MEQIKLPQAAVLTSPNPVTVVCTECQRRCDFVIFRRTENVEKRWVKVYSF